MQAVCSGIGAREQGEFTEEIQVKKPLSKIDMAGIYLEPEVFLVWEDLHV